DWAAFHRWILGVALHVSVTVDQTDSTQLRTGRSNASKRTNGMLDEPALRLIPPAVAEPFGRTFHGLSSDPPSADHVERCSPPEPGGAFTFPIAPTTMSGLEPEGGPSFAVAAAGPGSFSAGAAEGSFPPSE